ncbi:MAG: sugar phosphate isomerase/epimerase family protein [Thermodesulfobacteriota bacterium]
MLGISTSFRSEIASRGEEIIKAILDLGLKNIELEYRISRAMFQEIKPYIKKEEIRVISIHNFFPTPDGIPKEIASGDFYSLSSLDEEERKLAVKYSLETIQWAQELGAQAVVLHLGKIPGQEAMEVIKGLHDQLKIDTPEGKKIIDQLKESRSKLGKLYLDQSMFSLQELIREGERKGILLGIENRYNIHDFPNREELKLIFQKFHGSCLRYWHDIGHATTQQNLRLEEQQRLLSHFGNFMVGVHLHGCRGYHDHEAPGAGEENYGPLKKLLKPETIRIIETHHRATLQDLKKGIEFLKKQGII